MLQNYSTIPDQFKFEFEIDGVSEQMIILVIFNFHQNLNNLKEYSNNSTKIIRNKERKDSKDIKDSKDSKDGKENVNELLDTFLNFSIYDHGIIENEQKIMENKKNFKYCLNFLKEFVKIIMLNINEDNILLIEKMVIILLYWLSINNDVFNLVVDQDIKRELKFLNYLLQESQEMKELQKDKVALSKKIEQINTMILPIETTFHVNITNNSNK